MSNLTCTPVKSFPSIYSVRGANRLIIELSPLACTGVVRTRCSCSERAAVLSDGHRLLPSNYIVRAGNVEILQLPKPIEEPERRSDARGLDNRPPLRYAKKVSASRCEMASASVSLAWQTGRRTTAICGTYSYLARVSVCKLHRPIHAGRTLH